MKHKDWRSRYQTGRWEDSCVFAILVLQTWRFGVSPSKFSAEKPSSSQPHPPTSAPRLVLNHFWGNREKEEQRSEDSALWWTQLRHTLRPGVPGYPLPALIGKSEPCSDSVIGSLDLQVI